MKNKNLLRALFRTWVVTLLFAFCFFASLARLDAGETTGALPYLRMGGSARALGMGGAFTAVSDDASSIFWNPAGLANIERMEVSTMYSLMSLDRTLNWVNFVMPIRIGKLGIGLINSGVSDIKGYDEGGNPTGEFGYQSTTIIFSHGRKIEQILSGGFNLKIITDKLKDNSRWGFGLDLGVIASPTEKMKFGLKLQDIVGSIGSDTIPMSISLGLSYRVLKDNLLLSADVNKIADIDKLKLRFGTEYLIGEILSVQVGLNDLNLTFGTGLRYGIFNFSFAYVVDNLKVSDRYHFSFGVKF